MIEPKLVHQRQSRSDVGKRRADKLDAAQHVIARAKKARTIGHAHFRAGRTGHAHQLRKQDVGVDVNRARVLAHSCGTPASFTTLAHLAFSALR